MTGPVRAPRVRVVVLNWNSAWYSRRCLRALAETRYPADALEVVVVDNGSVDGSLEQLRFLFPHLRFIANGANLGFAEGCNRAMRDLDTVDHVALVNNDTIVDPDWLAPLVDALEVDPQAGAAAAAMVLDPPFAAAQIEVSGGTAAVERILVDGLDVTDRCRLDGARTVPVPEWPMEQVHHVDARLGPVDLLVPAAPGPKSLSVIFRGEGEVTVSTGAETARTVLRGSATGVEVPLGAERRELLNGLGSALDEHRESHDLRFGEPAETLDGLVDSPVPGFCGGAVLLRGAMLRQVGLFDPRFFAYYEDVDLAWRARRVGWRTVAVPTAVVRHALGGSGGSRAAAFFFLNHRNWLLSVMRNDDRRAVLGTLRNASARAKYAFSVNVLGRLRAGRAPDLRLVSAWARVLLGVLLEAPRIVSTRRRGVRTDTSVTRVRSPLQPRTAPRPPSPRPGGPLLLFLVLGRESVPEPDSVEAQFLRCTLSLDGLEAEVEILPVVRVGDGRGLLRLLSPAEMSRVLRLPVSQRVCAQPEPVTLTPAPRTAVIDLAAAMGDHADDITLLRVSGADLAAEDARGGIDELCERLVGELLRLARS